MQKGAAYAFCQISEAVYTLHGSVCSKCFDMWIRGERSKPAGHTGFCDKGMPLLWYEYCGAASCADTAERFYASDGPGKNDGPINDTLPEGKMTLYSLYQDLISEVLIFFTTGRMDPEFIRKMDWPGRIQ